MDAVWDRGTEYVNLRRQERIGEWGRDHLSLADLVEIYIVPFTEYMDSQSPSYWARFNEDALRGYPLVITPLFRQVVSNYSPDVPFATLLWVFEEIERRICGGRQPEAGIRVGSLVRGTISSLAAWERDTDAGRSEISVRDLGRQLVVTGEALLQA